MRALTKTGFCLTEETMNEHQNSPKSSPEPIAVGIDWADSEHVVCLIDGHGSVHISTLEQSPQAIDEWVAELRKNFPGKTFAVAIEQSKGPLIHALMKYEILVLYPINPKQLSRYRDAIFPSGSKDDPGREAGCDSNCRHPYPDRCQCRVLAFDHHQSCGLEVHRPSPGYCYERYHDIIEFDSVM